VSLCVRDKYGCGRTAKVMTGGQRLKT